MRPVVVLLLVVLAAPACSPKRIGMSRMADALSSTSTAFGRDNDPEFVRVAAPSTLKMVEMMLDDQPQHAGLLMTACSGFTQYAYGFLQVDAELLGAGDPAAARDLRDRAGRMYERALGYCLRHLEMRHPDIRGALRRDPKGALARATVGDVPALYWTSAAWGGAITLAGNPLLRIPEVGAVRALLQRALELDGRWERGALHEAMIALEGLPVLLGGSRERARGHFERAVALSNGQSAFTYVTMASSVVGPREPAEYEKLLRAAMAVDVEAVPDLRLTNLIAQRRAAFLLKELSGGR